MGVSKMQDKNKSWFTRLSIIAVIIGFIVGIVYIALSHTSSDTTNSTNIGVKITDDMEESDYVISAGENINYSATNDIEFGNDLLDLKKLSDDNNHATLFTVVGHVNFGFLVDPDMDCHINGIGNALAICYANDLNTNMAVGIFVGRHVDDPSVYSN
jgi:hypothetical protein